MDYSLDPRQLLLILWSRKWWFVTPAVVVVAVAVALAVLLPPTYRSDALILVEDQDIPEDIVPSLINDYIDRRLDMLTRRVLVDENLISMIGRYDLYPAEAEVTSSTVLAERMRDDIQVNTLSTEINDPRVGRTTEMTVAFEIAFEYHNAANARRVTDELVSLYLSMNQETRRQAATQTTEFLSSERAALEERIAGIEDELATFQIENRELLPQEAAFKRQLLANTEQQMQSLERDLRSLREREGFLTTEIALTDEFEPRDERGPSSASPEALLEAARAELATARARYSASHPDVVRLRREVASLEAVVGDRVASGRLAEREELLVSELAALRERYTDTHPDVVRAERELASVSRARDAAEQRGEATGSSTGLTRNSAYVQLSAQLNSVQAEIGSIEEQRRQLQEERRGLQEQLARAPAVEREYQRLNRRLENALADREALATKEASASLSSSMETAAISERFVLAEPASVPLAPVSPPQKLILVLGLVLAVGSGGVAVTLAELLDRSVRSAAQLARILGDTPLAVIPTIVSPAEQRRRWGRRAGVALLVIAVASTSVVWVHRSIVPLDVLGYQAQNRAQEWWVRTFPTTDAD